MWYLSSKDIIKESKSFDLSKVNIIGSGAVYFPFQSKLLKSAYPFFSKAFFFADEVIDQLLFFRHTGKYTIIKWQKT